MREFTNESFYGLFDRGEKLLLEDLKLEGCSFTHAGISMTADINRMTTLRNVQLTNCAADGVSVGPTIFQNVTITNLNASDLLIVWSPYLDRVTLKGDICKIKVNTNADPSTWGNAKQKPFNDFRSQFYANVDWALDISEARFKEFDLESVPAHLVRRDPESQVVVTREKALQFVKPGWETLLDPSCRHWAFVIDLFLSDGDDDIVLVAPLGAAKAKRDSQLKGLNELRRIGLAEPD
jgi:hypothetical protein